MKIDIKKLEFCGPTGTQEIIGPSNQEIETTAKQLFQVTGGINLLAYVDGCVTSASITGQAGLYVVEVTSATRGQFKLLTNSLTKNPEQTVPMCDGEAPRKNTIDDLDMAIELLKNYIETGRLVDSAPYFWVDC